MFRKLGARLRRGGGADSKGSVVAEGAAVPYREPGGNSDDEDDVGRSAGGEAAALHTAAYAGDYDAVRRLMKAGEVDVNQRNEAGVTALQVAAGGGQTRTCRLLLLHGADIETTDTVGRGPLHAAVNGGHTTTVGMLLDYMHSVDTRPRRPFVLLRGRLARSQNYALEQYQTCGDVTPLDKRGVNQAQFLISHGQRSDDVAIFLYSVLDVPVEHAFLINTVGELNMKNFQRFEKKERTQSLTVLNSLVKIVDVSGYQQLRFLILVSCGLIKLSLDRSVEALELLDVRHNKLKSLPENLNFCPNLKTLRCSHNSLYRLPSGIGVASKSLIILDCSYNLIKRLPTQLIYCSKLVEIKADHNQLIELPMDIGLLADLEELYVHNNKLSQIPLSLPSLTKLKRLTFHANPLQNIPPDFPEGVEQVRQYLQALRDDPVPNTTVKLVLVGQEGVGKSTLLGALKKTFWVLSRDPHTPKTDGVDVKDIYLDDLTLRCFDCGGDVDFNETHNFFITQGALYLACFNLSEYTQSTIEQESFLLGRLQLWLQYIFSKVPTAQVLIIGTHADHPSLTRPIFMQIWEQLRSLLVTAREHHRQYFRSHRERLPDCLLCQSDSRCLRKSTGGGGTGFVNLGYDDLASTEEDSSLNDGPASTVCFPHIVGYYEVSSVKPVGNKNIMQLNTNQSIEHLKDAIKELSKRLIKINPDMPRKWVNVQESLHKHIQMNPERSLATMEEVSIIANAQGVAENKELLNLLSFLKAQGDILYFPKLDGLQNTVILDPEWLATIFSSVVSYRDTGITDEGFIDREQLNNTWGYISNVNRGKILPLLHHFGVCLPVSGTTLELFPCKLAHGEPDENLFPLIPEKGENQITHKVAFSSVLPPPFFSSLMVAVYRQRYVHPSFTTENIPQYFSDHILELLAVSKLGCKDCRQQGQGQNKDVGSHVHKVHFKLVAHTRSLLITIRGSSPCCVLKMLGRILNKVATQFEGVGAIKLDTIICPGCIIQEAKSPYSFNLKDLREKTVDDSKVICSNVHMLPNAKGILCGFLPSALLTDLNTRPKSNQDKLDFSGCPRLFVVLPVNTKGISFDQDLKLFVSSVVLDGYAAHLLCEFPDGFHVTNAPGYRLRRPQEFMGEFGEYVIDVLEVLRHLAGSTVSPQFAGHTRAITATVEALVRDYHAKFPALKQTSTRFGKMAAAKEALTDVNYKDVLARGRSVTREALRRHLHLSDRADCVGPLRRLRYGDQMYWLCGDHYKQMRMLSLGTVAHIQADVESSA